MPKFRKRPAEVEAHRLGFTSYARIREFCPDIQIIRKALPNRGVAFAIIPTLEGDMRAELGDWIIRGVQGEFYPIKPDIFEQTYEEVPE